MLRALSLPACHCGDCSACNTAALSLSGKHSFWAYAIAGGQEDPRCRAASEDSTAAAVAGASWQSTQTNSSQAGPLEVSSPTPALQQVVHDLFQLSLECL